ncbi:RES family NAD+ phosphorylase [Mesorhizobium sp. CN2-181]|uniref:RES family NAD+ phosphorylase n=1 Tax=Mesorhizobium yinganensis TaxID=3157707 RepID=UPI0032B84FCD
MRITRVDTDGIFHRYLIPKCAFLPTRGVGVAIDGRRFNRTGVEAPYLSRAPPTELEEYKQRVSIVPPATLAAYSLLAEVADLSPGIRPKIWGRRLARIGLCLTPDRLHRLENPPSWKLAQPIITAGLRGILVPSLRHVGRTNLLIVPAIILSTVIMSRFMTRSPPAA